MELTDIQRNHFRELILNVLIHNCIPDEIDYYVENHADGWYNPWYIESGDLRDALYEEIKELTLEFSKPDRMETIERPTDALHHGGDYQGPLYAKHPDL